MTKEELIKELESIGFERRDFGVSDGSTMVYSVSDYTEVDDYYIKVPTIYFYLFDGWRMLWKFHHRNGRFYYWSLTSAPIQWVLIEDEDLSIEAMILLYGNG